MVRGYSSAQCKKCRKWCKKIIEVLILMGIVLGGLFLIDLLIGNYGWRWTIGFATASWMGAFSSQAMSIVAARERQRSISWRLANPQGVRFVCNDVISVVKEAFADKHSAAFLFRSLKWGALTIAAKLLSQAIAPQMPMGGD